MQLSLCTWFGAPQCVTQDAVQTSPILAIACLAVAGAAAHGCVGVGGAEPPGEEVVPGLAQQTADVARCQDGGASRRTPIRSWPCM